MRFKIDFKTNIDIPTDFIYKFLNISNPTYFAIYIYTFNKVYNGQDTLEYSEIAMDIEFATEMDVITAFKYFEKKDCVKIEDNLITFLSVESKPSINENQNYDNFEISKDLKIDSKPVYDMREIELYRKNDEGIRNLFIVAERNFGRTLKSSDIFIIFEIYDRLMFPVETIEYLLEYYTSKGITNMDYILSAAINWHDKGIKTKQDAINFTNVANEDFMKVRKALGNTSKNDKTYAETKMLDKFYNEYGYTLDIILEGCDAAVMSSKGNPSYNYLEGILSNWYNEGVRTIEDVRAREMDMDSNRKKNKTKKVTTSTSKNKFANFSQKSLDFQKYEKLNQERLEKIAKGEDV